MFLGTNGEYQDFVWPAPRSSANFTCSLRQDTQGAKILRRTEYQATVYLTSTERDSFEVYSRKFLLDAAGLLALLFGREMRVGRLRELIPRDVAPGGSRKHKITAHLKSPEHAALTALAVKHGVSLSHIGAVLVRDELRDRWLERSCPTRLESRTSR